MLIQGDGRKSVKFYWVVESMDSLLFERLSNWDIIDAALFGTSLKIIKVEGILGQIRSALAQNTDKHGVVWMGLDLKGAHSFVQKLDGWSTATSIRVNETWE